MSNSRKPVLHVALSLLFVLMGAANLFTVSVDDDDDDATPPIKMELNFVACSRKGPISRERAQHHKRTAPVHEMVSYEEENCVSFEPSLITHSASPQQVTPLRT